MQQNNSAIQKNALLVINLDPVVVVILWQDPLKCAFNPCPTSDIFSLQVLLLISCWPLEVSITYSFEGLLKRLLNKLAILVPSIANCSWDLTVFVPDQRGPYSGTEELMHGHIWLGSQPVTPKKQPSLHPVNQGGRSCCPPDAVGLNSHQPVATTASGKGWWELKSRNRRVHFAHAHTHPTTDSLEAGNQAIEI